MDDLPKRDLDVMLEAYREDPPVDPFCTFMLAVDHTYDNMTHEDMAKVLWAKYAEWSGQFANGMMTPVRDGAGDIIPLDDVDLGVIEKHDRQLYESLKRRAYELGITAEELEKNRP